jgi:transposase
MVLKGPINCEWFEPCVAQVPVPEINPDNAVILDNLTSHGRPAAHLAVEATGAPPPASRSRLHASASVFLPPDNPDFIPIEKGVARLRALSARPPSKPSRASGPPSGRSRTCSSHRNAPVTSPAAAMLQIDQKRL